MNEKSADKSLLRQLKETQVHNKALINGLEVTTERTAKRIKSLENAIAEENKPKETFPAIQQFAVKIRGGYHRYIDEDGKERLISGACNRKGFVGFTYNDDFTNNPPMRANTVMYRSKKSGGLRVSVSSDAILRGYSIAVYPDFVWRKC